MGRGRPARFAIVIGLSPWLKQNPPPYRFRPGRSAHQAVAQAQSYVAEGHEWVVDIDLEKSFDRVNHGQSLPDDPASAQGQRLEERGGSKWGAKLPGIQISNDPEPTRQITAKALEKFKGRVREPTCRTLGVSVPQLIAPLARHLIGWRGYFGFCQTPLVLHNLDAWIRRRLRMYIWRQWKNGRTRYAQLRRLGVSHSHAAIAAGTGSGLWRMARHVTVQQALTNAFFGSLGLPRLETPPKA